MHGGHIGIVSNGVLGDGCIFYVDLKIAQSDELDAISSVFDGSNPSSSSNDPTKIDSTSDPLSIIEVKPVVDEHSLRDDTKGSNERLTTPSQSTGVFSSAAPLISPLSSPITSSPSLPLSSQPPTKHSIKIIPGDSIIEGQKLSRALVVDDVASNRKMLGRVIQSRFHQIDYAENGKIAVDLVQESEINEEASRFSVIFMDCNMPGCYPLNILSIVLVMDGIEATKRIRALGFRGRMFGVTGNALGEDMDEFLSSGLDKVLTKPLNMEKLIQAMNGSLFYSDT